MLKNIVDFSDESEGEMCQMSLSLFITINVINNLVSYINTRIDNKRI